MQANCRNAKIVAAEEKKKGSSGKEVGSSLNNVLSIADKPSLYYQSQSTKCFRCYCSSQAKFGRV